MLSDHLGPPRCPGKDRSPYEHGSRRCRDLVQETYTRAWRGFADQGRGDGRLWLVAICLNAARLELRHTRRRPVTLGGGSELDEHEASEDVSGDALVSVERQADTRALAALPEAQRRAIVLVDIGVSAPGRRRISKVLPRGTILARLGGARDGSVRQFRLCLPFPGPRVTL